MIYSSVAPSIQGLTTYYCPLQSYNILKEGVPFSDLNMSFWQLHWEQWASPRVDIGLLSAFRAQPATLNGHKGSSKYLEPFQKYWDNIQAFYSCRYKMLILIVKVVFGNTEHLHNPLRTAGASGAQYLWKSRPLGWVFPDVTCRQLCHPTYSNWNREIRKGLCCLTAPCVTTLQRAELPSPRCVSTSVLSRC